MDFFNIVSLAGGLGLFLYGMSLLGASFEKLASKRAEALLRSFTSSVPMGALVGMVVTAVIQSSSATTVIAVGLVNSSVITFRQALGLVMGANIGTTITGQILRLSDISGDSFFLRLAKPETLAPAALIIGSAMYMASKSEKKKTGASALIGFGILFTGMSMMEGAVAPLRSSSWFATLFTSLQNPFLGVLAGALVTAVIQSSSASVGILQALTTTGAVTWAGAVPIILGQNIGTCITAMLSSIGASRPARRVAVSHLYFNAIGTIVWLALVYSVKAVFGIPFWHDAMNMGDIANFHTAFNVGTVLAFLPFSKALAALCEKTVPDKKEESHPELDAPILDERLFASPVLAIESARDAITQMARIAGLMLSSAQSGADDGPLMEKREEALDAIDVSATSYLVGITHLELSEEQAAIATDLMMAVYEFERIGDYAEELALSHKKAKSAGVAFSERALAELTLLRAAVSEAATLASEAFCAEDENASIKVEPLCETIEGMISAMRENHIVRLKAGICSIENGYAFLEEANIYERITSHASNIAALTVSASTGEPNRHEMLRRLRASSEGAYPAALAAYKAKYSIALDGRESEI